MTELNRQIVLASRPLGMPTEENFKLLRTPLPSLAEGDVLVQTLYLSVDPYIRGRMRNVKSYVEPLKIGEVIDGGVAGRVVESRNASFNPGDFVTARLGWQEYTVVNGKILHKLDSDPKYLSASLGVLGMPGLTAYFALLDLGQPKAGETVVISGAAGAVGTIAGQIAKIKGCRVVGIAGSDQKTSYLRDELGFDEAINYKSGEKFRRTLKDACPNRIDIYFDNVGGTISDAAITQINLRARIIICGQISTYNREETELGPRNLLYLVVYRARMEGFLVHDYEARFSEGLKQLKAWLVEGRLKHRETIVEGLENAPKAFIGLFLGENIGKQIVRVKDPAN